jgi:hypothetical protein
MPLAFESMSHGTIAFGFFNIDSDMLLLEQYFLFGSEFCQHVSDMAENFAEAKYETRWLVYAIEDRVQIGDLMGAIHGIHHSGFIGELYRKFPFPKHTEEFKQKPAGYRNHALVQDIISAYAGRIHIPVTIGEGTLEVDIGEYKFSRNIFLELIKYVWRGGYPRWKDEIRPHYVEEMKNNIERHRHRLFKDIRFE